MKIKQTLSLVLACLALISCSKTVYQVYEVQSPDLMMKNNSLVFENEDCKISYNLWAKEGSMAFIFENKTGEDIFVDMSRSFFIKNGEAFDYYKNRSYETSVYEGIDLGLSAARTYISPEGYWPDRYDVPPLLSVKNSAVAKTGFSTSVRVQEPEYVCVPANTYKVMGVYMIYPKLVITCDTEKDNPKKEVTLEVYNENNTPLRLMNRLAYSFEEGSSSPSFIDNHFWLSSVKNYSRKAAVENKKEKVGCTTMTQRVSFFKIGGPNQFYVPFSPASSLPDRY